MEAGASHVLRCAPYLIGPRFYGRVAAIDSGRWHVIGTKRVELSASVRRVEAGRPVRFRIVAKTDAVHIVTNFPSPGLYKLWAQFQQSGEVLTVPFVVRVAGEAQRSTKAVPAHAVRIRVSQSGYSPARVEIPAGKALKLAFTRDSGPNCGGEVVFPSLGIRKTLPVGGTAVVELPALAAGEIAFACGMGMYRGMIVAR